MLQQRHMNILDATWQHAATNQLAQDESKKQNFALANAGDTDAEAVAVARGADAMSASLTITGKGRQPFLRDVGDSHLLQKPRRCEVGGSPSVALNRSYHCTSMVTAAQSKLAFKKHTQIILIAIFKISSSIGRDELCIVQPVQGVSPNTNTSRIAQCISATIDRLS